LRDCLGKCSKLTDCHCKRKKPLALSEAEADGQHREVEKSIKIDCLNKSGLEGNRDANAKEAFVHTYHTAW